MNVSFFASRNTKEILRDPLNIAFGAGFPAVLLLLLTAIAKGIEKQTGSAEAAQMFSLETLTPGIAVFGLALISLFSATLIAKDRSESFLMRLYSSPMTAWDFILGYALPLFPLSVLQILICFGVSLLLGLQITVNILLVIAVLFPCSAFFIGIGLLCGSVFNDKQVGGICGALLTNLSAWLSGTWFSLSLVGGAFEKIAYLLPFAHAVEAGRAAFDGRYGDIMEHLWWVIIYAVISLVAAAFVFFKKMKSGKI